MDLRELNHIINEFGQMVGSDDFLLSENGYAALFTESSVVINFDYYFEEETLVMMSTVSVIDETNRVAVYEELLQANVFWGDNHGVTLGLSPDGFHALMLYPIQVQGLDAIKLKATVDWFCKYSWDWSNRIASATGREVVEPPETVVDALERPDTPSPTSAIQTNNLA